MSDNLDEWGHDQLVRYARQLAKEYNEAGTRWGGDFLSLTAEIDGLKATNDRLRAKLKKIERLCGGRGAEPYATFARIIAEE